MLSALLSSVLSVTVKYKVPDVWTEADLDSLPADGHRYEILDGCLHMTPLNDAYHQIAMGNLLYALSDAVPGGSEVLHGIGVRVPGGNLIPDRSAKLLKYAETGIPSYWRVERDGTLIVHELDGAAYTTVATVSPGETWTAERPFAVTVDPAALLAD